MDAGGKLFKLRGAVRAVQLSNALVLDNVSVAPVKVTTVWIRMVFLLPFLWASIDPLRFIEVHPTPFAAPRSAAAYRDTSYFVSLLFVLMTIFATVLTHNFEAGRRHELPQESGKVSGRYAANPSHLQSERHATSCDA